MNVRPDIALAAVRDYAADTAAWWQSYAEYADCNEGPMTAAHYRGGVEALQHVLRLIALLEPPPVEQGGGA